MAIFSSLSNFFRRNKKKILITSGLSISLYYVIYYFVVRKFRNFQSSLQQEMFIKEQIKRRFIQTQTDCYYTLLALLPVLIPPIVDKSPTELITKALKLKKSNLSSSNKEISDSLLTTDNLTLHSNASDNELSLYLNQSKTELWKLLKIKTLSRFLTLIYSISSLLLLTRLQLNILARKSYLQSAIIMANGLNNSPENSMINSNHEDYFIEQSYLSLSWWLLNKGWENLNYHIESIVVTKFQLINARTELSINSFHNLLLETIDEINSNKDILIQSIWPNYDDLNLTLLNTNPSLINDINEPFLKLINETNLIVNNDVFINNLQQMVVSNIDVLSQNLSTSLSNQANIKLANLLAQLSVQCEILCNNNEIDNNINEDLSGNDYINNLNNLECLDDFSASIYSNIE